VNDGITGTIDKPMAIANEGRFDRWEARHLRVIRECGSKDIETEHGVGLTTEVKRERETERGRERVMRVRIQIGEIF
jgi:hypothetical protein